jgi:hypothetical protein
MIAAASAMVRHSGALLAVQRAPVRAVATRRRPTTVARTSCATAPRRRESSVAASSPVFHAALTVLKLAAGVLAGATTTLAVMNYQGSVQSAPALEPGRNETVIYRRAPLKSDARLTLLEASDHPAADNVSAYSPPAVQTIRFVNPDPAQTTYTLAALVQPMTKVGGFIAFPKREDASETGVTTNQSAARPGFPRKRAINSIAEVDEYLWEVYQRAPVKKDRSGDFTWKDPAAAERVGLSLKEYVIAGMDPDFREQLYHAGRAMDAEGIQWAILSAFRDDYRQKIASGFKARGGNSLHGGSRRTGGFGHGRAVDVTSADGDNSTVWKWLDANGAKYGLHRPMPGNDPAHLQSKGDWRKLAQSLRHTRSKMAGTGDGKNAGGVTKVVAADGAKR